MGVPFTDPMGSPSESRPYAVGPTVEVRLPAGFAVEASAIYRRIGQTYWLGPIPEANQPGIINRTRGNSWEFPVIGKYYFQRHGSVWQPYLGAGLAFRTVGFHVDQSVLSGSNLQSAVLGFHGESRSDLGVGATAAAGVRLRVGRMAFSPEVRYTRWGNHGNLTGRDQAGLFLGFSF